MTQTWWENSALSFSFIFSCNLMFNTSCLILLNLPPSPHSHCASSGLRPITSAMNALMESCIPVSSPFLISSNDPEELLYNTNQVTFFHSFQCYFFTYPLSPLSLLSCRSFPIWLSAPGKWEFLSLFFMAVNAESRTVLPYTRCSVNTTECLSPA